MDVAQWLRGLELAQYEQAFRDNAVDADTLPRLTSDDLKELGIHAVGHRRKLLDAISRLDRPLAHPANVGADAERRQLTVMFCDLVGSTALASALDPEEYRAILNAYHQVCARTVAAFGGFVAKYMGDGVLAYFGYPQAHEDDAVRAVSAGLALTRGGGTRLGSCPAWIRCAPEWASPRAWWWWATWSARVLPRSGASSARPRTLRRGSRPLRCRARW